MMRTVICYVIGKKRETYMIEMQKLREGQSVTTNSSGPQGRLTISDLKLPLKSEFMSKIGSSQGLIHCDLCWSYV